MQRQPDGAFVLAQRGGDRGDGCLAVALAPDPRGKLVQATRGIAAAVIDQRFAVDLANDQPLGFRLRHRVRRHGQSPYLRSRSSPRIPRTAYSKAGWPLSLRESG